MLTKQSAVVSAQRVTIQSMQPQMGGNSTLYVAKHKTCAVAGGLHVWLGQEASRKTIWQKTALSSPAAWSWTVRRMTGSCSESWGREDQDASAACPRRTSTTLCTSRSLPRQRTLPPCTCRGRGAIDKYVCARLLFHPRHWLDGDGQRK